MNKQILLTKRPTGFPAEDCWKLEETSVPKVEDGTFLVRNEFISLDPAMRGWMNESKSYISPVELGDVMRAMTIGRVVESKNNAFPVGLLVTGSNGIQQFTLSDGKNQFTVPEMGLPLPKYLGVLGMPGMTAYFGLLEIGLPKEGETVLVSGAAGAVGSIVGQIARLKGCKAVGIAGGEKKCRHIIDNLGFDGAIDYKSEAIYAAIKKKCPDKVDVYFDNVGGETLDAALSLLNRKGRIVICGAISQYNNEKGFYAPKKYMNLLVKRARMEGFVVFDYIKRYPEAMMQMAQWMAEGKLHSNEYVVEGIENFYDAFKRLFSGEKLGKLVLKV